MKCCDFKAGDFRQPAVLQRKSRLPDGQGGWFDGWVQVRKIMLKWSKTGGIREPFQFEQRQAQAAHIVHLRYAEPVPQADWRLLHKGKAYAIIGVVDVEQAQRIIELHLAEGEAP